MLSSSLEYFCHVQDLQEDDDPLKISWIPVAVPLWRSHGSLDMWKDIYQIHIAINTDKESFFKLLDICIQQTIPPNSKFFSTNATMHDNMHELLYLGMVYHGTIKQKGKTGSKAIHFSSCVLGARYFEFLYIWIGRWLLRLQHLWWKSWRQNCPKIALLTSIQKSESIFP